MAKKGVKNFSSYLNSLVMKDMRLDEKYDLEFIEMMKDFDILQKKFLKYNKNLILEDDLRV